MRPTVPRCFLGLVAVAGIANADTTPVARVAFPLGQEQFDLSPAANGVQTLSIPAAAGQLQWASAAVEQKFAAGQLLLLLPIGAGQSIVAGKPQSMPDGTTVFVFSCVDASGATAAPAPVAIAATASPTSPAPAAMPPAAAAPTPPVYPVPANAPAANQSTLPIAPPATGPSPQSLPIAPPAAPPPVAPVATAPAAPATAPASGNDVISALEQVLPGPVQMDPLAKADFAIPESPGAAVLDETTQIVRPASPRQTVTSLLSNFGPGGTLKTGFSLAVTPYTMLRATPVTLREYNDSEWKRFLTRLQLSMAAKTGEPPAGSTVSPALFGLGVSGVFFDNSDPRLDQPMLQKLSQLFTTSWGSASDAAAIARGENVAVPSVSQAKLDAYKSITDAAQRARWNAAAAGFGYALRLKSATGNVQNVKTDGGGAWLNLSAPGFGSLASNSQFLFTASYRYHDDFLRDGVSGIEDSFNLAGQYRVGTADFDGFGQAAHHWRAPQNAAHFSDTTIELGLERKLVNGLWLSVSWTNDKSLGGNSAVKTGLRYGFGQGATLGGPQQ